MVQWANRWIEEFMHRVLTFSHSQHQSPEAHIPSCCLVKPARFQSHLSLAIQSCFSYLQQSNCHCHQGQQAISILPFSSEPGRLPPKFPDPSEEVSLTLMPSSLLIVKHSDRSWLWELWPFHSPRKWDVNLAHFYWLQISAMLSVYFGRRGWASRLQFATQKRTLLSCFLASGLCEYFGRPHPLAAARSTISCARCALGKSERKKEERRTSYMAHPKLQCCWTQFKFTGLSGERPTPLGYSRWTGIEEAP